MATQAGFEVGKWPWPRPTGLDLFLVRSALGLSQRSIAFELEVARRRVIEWERGGATVLIPKRLAATHLANMIAWAEDNALLKRTKFTGAVETYQRGR